MADIQYLHIPLERATLVARKHPRDIQPPNMVELSNMFLSRSDNTLTIRPDWNVATDTVASGASSFGTGDTSYDDFVNSVSGIYGTETKIFFGTHFPMDDSVDVGLGTYTGVEHSTVISNTIASTPVTAAVTSGSNLVTTSADTLNMNEKAYRGAFVQFDDDTTSGRYWRIKKVVDDQTFALDDIADFTEAATLFTITQAHSVGNHDYKFHVEQFLANTLYNSPTIDDDPSPARIVGPFAASIVEVSQDDAYVVQAALMPNPLSASLEPMSRKGGAAGATQFVSVKPYYGVEDVDEGTNVWYSSSPQRGYTAFSKYDLDDLVAGAGIDRWTAEFGGQIASSVVYDSGNSCFWIPIIGYTWDGGFAVYELFLIKVTDAATPSFTAHKTDITFTDGNDVDFQNLCVNLDADELWLWYSETGAGFEEIQEYNKIDLAAYTSVQANMPGEVQVWGAEYCDTATTVLVTGVNAANAGVAYRWNGSAWATLTNPAGTPRFYGNGIYDDGTNWVYTITGGDTLYAWGKDDVTTIQDVSVDFVGSVQTDAYRCASNGAYFSAETAYDTNIFVSGHKAIGLVTVDPTTSSISWNEFVDITDYPYVHKIFASPKAGQYNRYYIASATRDITDTDRDIIIIRQDEEDIIKFYTGEFEPISDKYRSRAFGVLNGYVVLFGVKTYDIDDDGTDEWTYTPRRCRWTVPATVNNFEDAGSGTSDWKGNGEFLDARSVNGRIVTFESGSIGTMIPRGITDDPWDYDVIHEGIRIISNPVVVNDQCYFIATDGLMWMTNGVNVEESGSSLDLSKFDDFNPSKPVWLVFHEEINSLVAFYPSGSSDKAYVISLANGGVSSFDLQEASDESAQDPKSIVSVENSSDINFYVSHNPESTDTDRIVLGSFSFGDAVTGIDSQTGSDTNYWYGRFQTGELFPAGEGIKVALKHVILDTYTDSDAATDNPDIIVEIKSLEDTEWHGARDVNLDGELTVTTALCYYPTASAKKSWMTNYVGDLTGGPFTYKTAWPVDNCRIYRGVGAGAAPSILMSPGVAMDDNTYVKTAAQEFQVTFTAPYTLAVYCENEPAVVCEVDDYIESDEGYHRLTALSTFKQVTLDRYKASGTDAAASHWHAEQMPAGGGKVKIGVNKTGEGFLLRVTVLPRHGTGVTAQPTIAKVTGISLGFLPIGKKVLEATGS